MNSLIKELENISLSNDEVLKLVNGKANLILYPELSKINNIDDVLNPYGACIILFLTKKNYGHWTCIFKLDEDTIEYFDPYGLYIDDALNFKMNKYFRKVNNQDFSHLTYLLYKSPYTITYNQYKFQKKMNGVSTCGRHTAMRLILRKLSLEQYKELMTSGKYSPDKLVTLLTSYI